MTAAVGPKVNAAAADDVPSNTTDSRTSKYIAFGSMPVNVFARSQVGTRAEFLSTTHAGAVAKISAWLKSSCTRAKSKCIVESTQILVKQPDGSWHPAAIVSATITHREA